MNAMNSPPTDISRVVRAIQITGVTLIAVGLSCNEWVLTRLLSKDGMLEPSTLAAIRSFNLFMFSAGLVSIWFAPSLYARCRRLGQLVRRRPMVAMAIGLLTMTGAVAVAEAVCGFLDRERGALITEVIGPQPFDVLDPVLGYQPKANAQARVILRRKGKTIYDIVYTIDGQHRRVTPGPGLKTGRQFILFFGDSFTFGEGVNDRETMPSRVASATPGYAVYNYGCRGYGTQQMLARLDQEEIQREVPQQTGLLIYTFIDAHVERAIGSMRSFTGWAANTPYYALERGELVRKGSFATTRHPWVNAVYSVLGRSEILKYFRLDIPPVVTPRDLELVCRLIDASRDQFRARFGSDRFYVVLYPGSHRATAMSQRLQALGITVLDYSRLIDFYGDQRYQIPYDGHPTPQTHELIARHLVHDLGLGLPKDRPGAGRFEGQNH